MIWSRRQQGRLSFWLYSVCILSASGKNQAPANRYYHQLHPKPWAKSPEEAAWALLQRIMGLVHRFHETDHMWGIHNFRRGF